MSLQNMFVYVMSIRFLGHLKQNRIKTYVASFTFILKWEWRTNFGVPRVKITCDALAVAHQVTGNKNVVRHGQPFHQQCMRHTSELDIGSNPMVAASSSNSTQSGHDADLFVFVELAACSLSRPWIAAPAFVLATWP